MGRLDAPLAASSVDRLCQATAIALAEPVAALQGTLPRAAVATADETRWPQAGHTQWLWVVVTRLATVFTVAACRGSRGIKAHFKALVVREAPAKYIVARTVDEVLSGV